MWANRFLRLQPIRRIGGLSMASFPILALAGGDQRTAKSGAAAAAAPAPAVDELGKPIDPMYQTWRYGMNYKAGSGPQKLLSPMEHCAVKAGFAAVGGFAIGAFFALFQLGFDSGINNPATAGMTDWQKVKYEYRQTAVRGYANAKSFALMGVMFSTTECLIEKYRGKHSFQNTLAAGVVTGGVLAARSGPGAMLLGAGGFTVFTIAIEYFTGNGDAFKHIGL